MLTSVSITVFFSALVCWFLVGIILFVIGIIKGEYNKSSTGKSGVCGMLMILLLIFFLFFYKFPFRLRDSGGDNFRIFVVRGEGEEILEYRKWGAWEWEHYVNIPNKVEVESKIVLIDDSTDPHRLITIKYKVVVSVGGIVEVGKYLYKPNRKLSDGLSDVGEDIRKTVTVELEEFNANRPFASNDFLHPSNKDEQVKFSDVLAGWLDPRLEKHGLTVKFVSFSVE